MTEKFEVFKAHKMSDWIENHVTDWAHDLVTEHFGVEGPEELSREQIDEVIEEYNRLYEFDPTVAMGFRNVISNWENEHEEYLI